MYDYIGKPSKYDNEPNWQIGEEERKRRIRALLEILLIDRFVLPRRTNSLNIPEYYYALVSLSPSPLPIYQYLDYTVLKDGVPELDKEKLKELQNLVSVLDKKPRIYLIDYTGRLAEEKIGDIEVKRTNYLKTLIEESANWLLEDTTS